MEYFYLFLFFFYTFVHSLSTYQPAILPISAKNNPIHNIYYFPESSSESPDSSNSEQYPILRPWPDDEEESSGGEEGNGVLNNEELDQISKVLQDIKKDVVSVKGTVEKCCSGGSTSMVEPSSSSNIKISSSSEISNTQSTNISPSSSTSFSPTSTSFSPTSTFSPSGSTPLRTTHPSSSVIPTPSPSASGSSSEEQSINENQSSPISDETKNESDNTDEDTKCQVCVYAVTRKLDNKIFLCMGLTTMIQRRLCVDALQSLFWWIQNQYHLLHIGCRRTLLTTTEWVVPCPPHAVCSFVNHLESGEPFCPTDPHYIRPNIIDYSSGSPTLTSSDNSTNIDDDNSSSSLAPFRLQYKTPRLFSRRIFHRLLRIQSSS